MPNRKLLLHSILNQSNSNNETEVVEETDSESESELDSDEELQRDYAKGKLKPGLHKLVAFKRTTELINDKNGLTRKLNDIKIFKDNWIERLDVLSEPVPISEELKKQYGDLDLKLNKLGETSGEEKIGDNAQHDFKREMLFYRQAQATVLESLKTLRTKYGLKQILRPEDYFAEMAKSDDHMQKVRQRLQAKQTSIDASEKAKKLREMKKYGKKVQQEVQLKRQKEKKELLQKIQNYKKGKEESLDFLDDETNKKGKKAKVDKPTVTKTKLTKKQKYKEARYGYGGQKKRSKYNSSDSAANLSGFSAKKHGRPTIKKKNARPGKSRRQNIKQKRK